MGLKVAPGRSSEGFPGNALPLLGIPSEHETRESSGDLRPSLPVCLENLKGPQFRPWGATSPFPQESLLPLEPVSQVE